MAKVRKMGADFIIDYIRNACNDELTEEEWEQYLKEIDETRLDQILKYSCEDSECSENQWDIKVQLASDIAEAEFSFVSDLVKDSWKSVDEVIDKYESWFDNIFVKSELYTLYHSSDVVSMITEDIWKDM